MNWTLDIGLHWPHDRCAVGWEYIGPTDTEDISTFTLYIFICTISFNIYNKSLT